MSLPAASATTRCAARPDTAGWEQHDWSLLALGDGAAGWSDFRSPPALSFVSADFDEDGQVDLAIPAGGNRFRFCPGDGTGAFPPGVEITGPGVVCNLATADVEMDGHSDLVTASGSDQGWILYGDGDGGFARTQAVHTAHAAPSSGTSPSCGRAIGAQLDGAGKVDLAFVSDEQDRIAVLLNTSPGLP